jgi:hypothetical protein
MSRIASWIPDRARAIRMLFLFGLAATLTLTLQEWIGERTIYSAEMMEAREVAHAAIYTNHLPPGVRTWDSIGMNGVNIRIGVVALAELLHRVSGARVGHVYHVIDSVALFTSFVLLFLFLRRRAPDAQALVGVLFYAALMPLTYFLYRYHPWDRVSFLLWLVLVMLLERRRLVAFGVVLAAAVFVKYDVVVLPGLYFLMEVNRQSWRRVTIQTIGLFAVGFAVYLALLQVFPGGSEDRQLLHQMRLNLTVFREMHLRYPPLLMFGFIGTLALYGLRFTDRFGRACAAMAVLVSIPLFVMTNFVEVRAETMMLLLLLPAALAGMSRLLEDAPVRLPEDIEAPEDSPTRVRYVG